MTRYPFSIQLPTQLEEACRNGFSHIFLARASHGRPISISLLSEAGDGINIQSVMHDLDSRLEIGALAFTYIEASGVNEAAIALPHGFLGKLQLEKLIFKNENFIVESGLAVKSCVTNEELLIVSGAFPYTVEILIPGYTVDFEPEYPIGAYTREAI